MTDLDYNSWFIQEVEEGQAQADRGELIDHKEVVKRIEKWLQDKQSGILIRSAKKMGPTNGPFIRVEGKIKP